MQKTLLLILSLFVFVFSNAQFKVVGEGNPFDEPEQGYTKLIQLKDGNTLFLHFTEKDGIYVKPYDNTHKEGAEVHIKPLYKELKGMTISGTFEMNGDIIVFANKFGSEDDKLLYRLIIDGTTGKLKEDKVIYTIEKLSRKQSVEAGYKGAPFPGYWIKKDPFSENYAVVIINTFAEDKEKRLEVFHYDADNSVISHTYLKVPGDYKYTKYMDMAVVGKDYVSIITHSYNNWQDGRDGSEVMLIATTPKNESAKFTRLDFAKNVKEVYGALKYNPVTGKLIAVVCVQETKKDNGHYIPYISYIDAKDGKLENSNPISPTAASAKSADLFKDHVPFTGLPQNVYVNKDGSFVVVHEEVSVGTVGTTDITNTKNVAVSMFSSSGAEVGSYLIPKTHYFRNDYFPLFYQVVWEGRPTRMNVGNQFKSFEYIDGATRPYVLFNDFKENEQNVSQGKRPTGIDGVTSCDAFAYAIEGKNIMPARKYVFGEPATAQHNLAAFTISDYDRNSNTLVTLKLNMDGKKKTVNLVWLQPS